MDEIDRHGVGSGIDWMNGCDRKKCPCGCEPCQSGLCRCYSWCRDEKDEIDPDEDVTVFE